jgi:CubicO group peptidase (beta-lactamase class C family)
LRGAAVAVAGPHVPGGTATCGIGFPTDHTFLLGSVGKALNGLIYSGMVADGTVRPYDMLDRFLPLEGTAAGAATLESLVTHISGLPATGGTRRDLLRMKARIILARDPQPEGIESLLGQLRRCRTTPGTFRYSNLGGSALGHALASAVGLTYPQLVDELLARPLGRPTIHVREPGCDDGPGDAPGLSVFNRRQVPWTGQGYAPAGGIRASADDLATLLHAMLHDPPPGWKDAFRPLFRVDQENSVGAGWFVRVTGDGRSREMVWHDGAAGGFVSAVVLDLASGRGVAVSVIDGTMQADLMPVARALLQEDVP